MSEASNDSSRFLLPVGTVILGELRVVRELGRGAFGIVLATVNIKTHQKLAVKLERMDTPNPQLHNETKILSLLTYDYPDIKGFPLYIRWEPELPEIPGYRASVMTMVPGVNLETLRKSQPHRKLEVSRVAGIALQALDRLEWVHKAGVAYRDVKPDNFLLDGTDLYLVDFGMCKHMIPEGFHLPNVTGKGFVGTPSYASVRTHRGYRASRRDDIEALGYVLVLLATGWLPWSRIPIPQVDTDNYAAIGDVKAVLSSEEIAGSLPRAFALTIEHGRSSVPYEAMPDYTYLRRLWTSTLLAGGRPVSSPTAKSPGSAGRR